MCVKTKDKRRYNGTRCSAWPLQLLNSSVAAAGLPLKQFVKHLLPWSLEEGQTQSRTEALHGSQALSKNKLKHHSSLHRTETVLGNEWSKQKCVFVCEGQSREAFREGSV